MVTLRQTRNGPLLVISGTRESNISPINDYGRSRGRPCFSFDGKRPAKRQEFEVHLAVSVRRVLSLSLHLALFTALRLMRVSI